MAERKRDVERRLEALETAMIDDQPAADEVEVDILEIDFGGDPIVPPTVCHVPLDEIERRS